MENVFITKSTFNIIVGELDIDKISEKLLGVSVFDKTKIDYLYSNQFKTILAYKYLSENPSQLFIYKKDKAKKAPKNYFLLETSTPKFHLFPDCDSITHRWENMIIPIAIREKGEKVIDEFREYLFNEFGRFSPKRYNELIDLIVTKINSKFQVNLSSDEISILDKENSGSTKAKNFSLKDLESNIIKFAEEYGLLCEKYPDIFPKFTLKAFLSKNPDEIKFIPTEYFKTNRKDEFVIILRDFYDKVQMPTFELLKQYYMVYFNPELKFEGSLLKQLGLKTCLKCIERSM